MAGNKVTLAKCKVECYDQASRKTQVIFCDIFDWFVDLRIPLLVGFLSEVEMYSVWRMGTLLDLLDT